MNQNRREKNEITFYQNGLIEIVDGAGKVSFPEHSHLCYMVGTVTAGSMLMKIGEHNFEMKKGMIYVIPSNTIMSMQYVEPVTYISICLKEELAELFNECKLKQNAFETGGSHLQEICEKFKKNEIQEQFIQELMTILKLEPGDDIEPVIYSELIEQAIAYINEHVEEKCNIEEMAEKLHVSKFHFCRQFHKEVGVSPKQYLQQNKLRYMKKRLLQEDSETKLAVDMEFAAQSHMCTLFKKYMGISIREYKNNLIIK